MQPDLDRYFPVTISELDIATGEAKSPCNCPIAQSFKRNAKNLIQIGVGSLSVSVQVIVGWDFKSYDIDLNESFKDFIFRFDNGVRVYPQTLLLPPNEYGAKTIYGIS